MKIIYLLLIVFLLSILSCTKDKNEPEPTLSSQIVGTYTGYDFTFEPNVEEEDTIDCQFKISKLDNKRVYIEFLSGVNGAKLTAQLSPGETAENAIRLLVADTQMGSTIIAGGSYKLLSPVDGVYDKNKREVSLWLVKIIDNKLYWIHVGGKKAH